MIKFLDFAKRLEEGLFKFAQTKVNSVVKFLCFEKICIFIDVFTHFICMVHCCCYFFTSFLFMFVSFFLTVEAHYFVFF